MFSHYKKEIITALFVVAVVFTPVAVHYIAGQLSTDSNTASAWGSTCGSCGSSGGSAPSAPSSDDDDNKSTPAKPKCTLKGSSNEYVIGSGNQVKLEWTTLNANDVTLVRASGNQSVNNSGDAHVFTNKGFTYKIIAKNSGGSTVCEHKVKAVDLTCELSGSSNQYVVGSGNKVKLNWTTTNADSVKLVRGSGTFDVNKSGNTEVWYSKDFTYKIIAKNGDKKVECAHKITAVTPDAPTPTCPLFTVNGSKTASILADGGNVTFKWDLKNAKKAWINNGVGDIDPNSGSKTVFARWSNDYVLTMENADGKQNQCKVRVERSTSPTPKTPVCTSFSANKSEASPGDRIELDWDTTNAQTVKLYPGGSTVAADGPTTVTFPSGQDSVTYLLNFDGKTDKDCRAVVTKKSTPTPKHPRCDFFRINESTVEPNDLITLEWGTTNTSNVSITRIGDVSNDGPTTVDAPDTNGTYTYTLRIDGKDTSCRDIVKVEKETVEKHPRCDFFRADDTRIDEGDDVTLEWGTTNADDVRINQGIGSVADDGDYTVNNLRRDTTFILTVERDGEEVECRETVRVDEDDDSTSSRPRPYCDLDISDDRIRVGEEVTLEWRTWNTDEVVLEDSEGNVLIDSDDKDDLDSEITIRPTQDLTFTLNAIDGRLDRECEVDVEVSGDAVTVTETRRQLPTVAGISLTQVPYTGFEAGPMLTLIFYALLAAWGLFVAYIVALRKGMISGVSFAANDTNNEFDTVTAETATSAPDTNDYVAQSVPIPTADVPSNLPTAATMAAPVVGYAAAHAVMTEEVDSSLAELENMAHEQKALFSSDAMRHFTSVVSEAEQAIELTKVIAEAKGTFPNEDGWVVINLSRLESLMETPAAPESMDTAPTTAGSLAEAIVTGNVVAAYQMIAHRPMIALADAAAELDTLVRVRNGADETVSELLTSETAHLTDEQIRSAVQALTSALDGTYSSEEEAVKMSILKAVKAVA